MLDGGVNVRDVGVEKEVVGTELEKEVVVRQGLRRKLLALSWRRRW